MRRVRLIEEMMSTIEVRNLPPKMVDGLENTPTGDVSSILVK
jgi:hypothetical protein